MFLTFAIIKLQKMVKKIAIPVSDGKLSSHFGHAPIFYIYDTENAVVIKESMENPPPHTPGAIPNWLADLKITDIIAGGMGQKAINIFNANQINVYTGAPVESGSKIVKDFLAGTLKTQANLCDNKKHSNCS